MGWPKYETVRKTWELSLRKGAVNFNSPKSPFSRLNAGVDDKQSLLKRSKSAPALKDDLARLEEGKSTGGSLTELTGAAGEELLHDSPYNREFVKRSGRKARHFYPGLQRNVSEPALLSSPRLPSQHGSPHKDVSQLSHRSPQARQSPIHLPALQGADQAPGNSSLRRGIAEGQKKSDASWEAAEWQPLPALRRLPISPSKELQATGTSSRRSKKPAQALSTICSAAQSISKELDKTMSKWQPKQEKKDELSSSLYGGNGRLSISLDAVGTPGSLLKTQDGSSGMERPVSSGESAPGIAAAEEFEEEEVDDELLREERLRQAFLHFVEPGTFDLNIENLLDLLRYVGHPVISTTGAAVQDLVKEVTGYEYLDYDEFISFMGKYVEYEKKNFHEVFMSYDDDDSGELDVGELRHLIKAVGIMGLSSMFREAMEAVDVDHNGTLDFEEFLKFLRIYQRNEGFTSDEVREIIATMAHIRASENVEKEAGNGIPADLLAEVLIRFFGMHTGPDAKELQEKIIKRHILHNPHSSPTFYLALKDVLLYGRQLREKYYVDLRNFGNQKDANEKRAAMMNRSSLVEFQRYDDDGDQKISESELRNALKTMQYEPLGVVIHEIFGEVLPEPFEDGRELDFEEFFDFLLVYRQREGFLTKDVEEFKAIFIRYDEDESGDVSTLELADVFRYMGYSLSVDELKKFVLVVDEDRTNELNFREYLHLMRLHRSSVIRKIRDAFMSRADHMQNQKLSRAGVTQALAKLGHADPPKEAMQAILNEPMDFDYFVSLADKCHKIKVSQERKRAGFSDTEMDNILELFHRFDKDGSGDIDCTELQRVFEAFGWAPKSQEEQEEIFGRLDRARALAREAGVEETSPDGSAFVTKWEYVQLARMIRRQQETAAERYEAKLAQELRFSMPEVNEFRQVFHYWRKIDAGFDNDSDDDEDGAPKEEVLSRDTMRRLVRSMGVRFTVESKDALDKQMETEGKGSPFIDFHAFLHLMRWILDKDFGGVVTKQNEDKKK